MALPMAEKIQLWAKHEDVAMHFNDLTMRLRLQALAGVGAATLVAGGISTHQGQLDMRLLGAFTMAISFVWIGIWALDRFYYQRLLKGAVSRIVELERWTPSLRLSTRIEEHVMQRGRSARGVFYWLIFALLFAGGIILLKFGASTSHESAGAPVEASGAASASAAPRTGR